MNKFQSESIKLDFNDVLIVPRKSTLSSRSEVNMVSNLAKEYLGIDTNGIIAANMDGVGTFEMAKVLKKYGCTTSLTKHYTIQELLEFYETDDSTHTWYTMGANETDLDKFNTFFTKFIGDGKLSNTPLKVTIDAANAYQSSFISFCKEFKLRYPTVFTMAGNVVDINGYIELRKYVDVIKIGIGGGSQCRTRTQTGIGYPQLSAICDLFDNSHYSDYAITHGIAKKSNICSDGGCSSPGDIVKAIAAGAGYVMIGTMLAGTTEGGGTIIDINGKPYVEFYGMSSKTAQNKHNGGLRDYRSSEGRTVLLPYKGSVEPVIKDILGGIRSACTYVGARNIDDLTANSQFIRVNNVINKSMEQYTVGN